MPGLWDLRKRAKPVKISFLEEMCVFPTELRQNKQDKQITLQTLMGAGRKRRWKHVCARGLEGLIMSPAPLGGAVIRSL